MFHIKFFEFYVLEKNIGSIIKINIIIFKDEWSRDTLIRREGGPYFPPSCEKYLRSFSPDLSLVKKTCKEGV